MARKEVIVSCGAEDVAGVLSGIGPTEVLESIK